MSEAANSTNEHEQTANEHGEHWLTVREAAKQLGIGMRGVQQRVVRGKIRNKREGDRLLVCLEALPIGNNLPDEQREQASANNEPSVREQTANRELLDELKADVAFLRSQLQQRDQAESEFRRLLLIRDTEIQRLMQENRRLLIAAPVDVEAEPAVQDTQEGYSAPQTAQELAKVDERPPRRWWEFWK